MASYTPNYNLYKPAGTDQFDNFLTEFGNNMDVIDSNLGGGGGSSTLAGLSDVNLTSPVTNDALIYDGAEWVNSPLSAVAFSGDYSDLSNTPTIPTKTSDLNNDSDFVSDSAYVHTDNNFTNADVTKLSGIQAGAEVNVQSDWNEADNTADDYIKNKPTIPTNTSDLNNDSGFLDSSDITVTQVQTTGTKIATIDVDGNSTDLYAPTGGGGSYTEGDGIDITSNTISVDTTFTEASTRANIDSGDTFSTILGKIKKWFTDLPSMFVSKSGDAMTGQLTITDTAEVQFRAMRNHTNTTSQPSGIMIGNNIPDGTTGSDYGRLIIYGKGVEYTRIESSNTSNRRVQTLPDKDGTFAMLSDLDTKSDKVGDYIFSNTSRSSSYNNKYCLVANIEVTGPYINGVVEVVFSIRGHSDIKKLEFQFASTSSINPTVDYFWASDDQISAYLVRTETSKWGLYVAYNQQEAVANYTVFVLHSIIYNTQFSANATITPVGTAVTALPTGTSVKAKCRLYTSDITSSASDTYRAIYELHSNMSDGQRCACLLKFSSFELYVTGYRKSSTSGRYTALGMTLDEIMAYRINGNTIYQNSITGTITSSTIN